MEKKEILTMVSGVSILILLILASVFIFPKEEQEEIKTFTDKESYKIGEVLKIKIENNLEKNICFSSCYPYYIEKKENGWKSYSYAECLKEDLIEKCVAPKETRAFELVLSEIGEGIHRLAISACLGCQLKEKFKETQKIYSNQFIIE